MNNLKRCKEEITQLSDALKEVDRVMDSGWNFFKSMDDRKINFSIHKIKQSSADFERTFAQLHILGLFPYKELCRKLCII